MDAKLSGFEVFEIKVTSQELGLESRPTFLSVKPILYADVSLQSSNGFVLRRKTLLGENDSHNSPMIFPTNLVSKPAVSTKLVIQLQKKHPLTSMEKNVGQSNAYILRRLLESPRNNNGAGSKEGDIRVEIKETSGELIACLDFAFKFSKIIAHGNDEYSSTLSALYVSSGLEVSMCKTPSKEKQD